MSKVLITGDKGYIGTKLKSFLKKKEVTVFTLKKRIDKDFIKNKNLPIADIVVHLAAKTNVPKSWNYEDDYIVHNINSTKYILDYCVKNKCKMIFISSYLYGNTKKIPTSEKSVLKTLNPYALSKKMCEDMCYFYEKYYGINLIIIRPFNIYGPGMGQYDYRIFPNFISNILNNKKIKIYGSGNQTRTYCYITDALEGFIRVICSGKSGEAYNIGNNTPEVSVKEIFKIFQNIHKSKINASIINHPKSYPKDEPQRRCPDINKAKKDLNYKPKIKLKDGLKKYLEWAKIHYKY